MVCASQRDKEDLLLWDSVKYTHCTLGGSKGNFSFTAWIDDDTGRVKWFKTIRKIINRSALFAV